MRQPRCGRSPSRQLGSHDILDAVNRHQSAEVGPVRPPLNGLSFLPGPVLRFELSLTARSARFYLFRATYAAILLVILGMIHLAWEVESASSLASHMVIWFAFSAFGGIAIAQE